MSERNQGLTADILFVAVTRPPMRWGVTLSALLFNLVFTMEVFLLTKNLLTLLIAIPIHGVCALRPHSSHASAQGFLPIRARFMAPRTAVWD